MNFGLLTSSESLIAALYSQRFNKFYLFISFPFLKERFYIFKVSTKIHFPSHPKFKVLNIILR